MKLTREMIQSGASIAGGWNRAQLTVLGVSWPPKKGWAKALAGTEISEDAYAQFLKLKKSENDQQIKFAI